MIATYIGPIPHLKGHRAMISNRPSRAWIGAPAHILDRSIFAQFNDLTVQKRVSAPGRSKHKHLGYGWHRFDVRDFKLDAGEVVEVEQTCTACPSQFEGRLANGAYFYARYRGARVRIGIADESVNNALDRVLGHGGGDVCYTRRTVSKYDGYMTWEEMEPFFIKAICAYRDRVKDWYKRSA